MKYRQALKDARYFVSDSRRFAFIWLTDDESYPFALNVFEIEYRYSNEAYLEGLDYLEFENKRIAEIPCKSYSKCIKALKYFACNWYAFYSMDHAYQGMKHAWPNVEEFYDYVELHPKDGKWLVFEG